MAEVVAMKSLFKITLTAMSALLILSHRIRLVHNIFTAHAQRKWQRTRTSGLPLYFGKNVKHIIVRGQRCRTQAACLDTLCYLFAREIKNCFQ